MTEKRMPAAERDRRPERAGWSSRPVLHSWPDTEITESEDKLDAATALAVRGS